MILDNAPFVSICLIISDMGYILRGSCSSEEIVFSYVVFRHRQRINIKLNEPFSDLYKNMVLD